MEQSTLVAILVVASVFSSVQADAPKFSEILGKCKASEKATDTDFLNYKTNVKPKTRAMKCLITCIGEKLGNISNNKLDPEGLLAYVKMLPINNDKVQQSIKEIIEECKNIQDHDRCENGSKLMDCITDGAFKRGIQPGAFYNI